MSFPFRANSASFDLTHFLNQVQCEERQNPDILLYRIVTLIWFPQHRPQSKFLRRLVNDKLGLKTGQQRAPSRSENLQSLSAHQNNNSHSVSPTVGPGKTIQWHECHPPICKQQRPSTPCGERRSCRPVAIFLAKCQSIKKALVYEHLGRGTKK